MTAELNLTGQGDKTKRRALDFYPTPVAVTHALMDFLQQEQIITHPINLWEPACGDGAMSRVMERYGHRVFSSDIRDTGFGQGGIDFLSADVHGDGIQAIITNPPFAESHEFILKALEHAPIVAMVLKSQYWHASKRTELFKAHPPAYVLALNWRPDFMNKERGGAPTMECVWTVWIEGQTDTRYRILQKPKVIT